MPVVWWAAMLALMPLVAAATRPESPPAPDSGQSTPPRLGTVGSTPSLATVEARERRLRFVFLALIILVVIPWVGYFVAIVAAARSARTETNLARNLATAQLNAHLVDQDYRAALTRLASLARKHEVPDISPTVEHARSIRDVGETDEVGDNIVFAALYRANGRLMAAHPPESALRDASHEAWFRAISGRHSGPYVGPVRRLPGKRQYRVVTLAVPVGRGSKRWAYAVGYWRVENIQNWVDQVKAHDVVRIDILSADGGTVVTNALGEAIPLQQRNTAIQNARRVGPGDLVMQGSPGQGRLLASFAPVEAPGWIALVTQPESSALAVTDYLVFRMIGLCLAVSALTGLTAWALLRQFRYQHNLAREHAAMALQLSEQNKVLKDQQESSSVFLANASHDLWTPLASLRFTVSSLLDPDVPWTLKQVRDSLVVANTELDQMTRRVRNLLEMSRLDAHADTTPMQPCDLEGVARAALERCQALLAGRSVELDFPKAPLLIECRQEQIETVLLNLIENAVKYSPAGTPLLLKGDNRDNRVIFALCDRGPGIETKDLRQIFEKFYRAQPEHPSGGTGLGLAICKAVIDEHGGRIGADNRPGGGAEFWFELPALALPRGKWR